MQFDDLSDYEYGQRPKRCVKAVNVGWLSPSAPFVTGAVHPDIAEKIRILIEKPINLTRGYHACEFCLARLKVPDSDSRLLMGKLRELGALGNGEILVTGVGGICYLSPVLLAHYIEFHSYRPPDEFCSAVSSMQMEECVESRAEYPGSD